MLPLFVDDPHRFSGPRAWQHSTAIGTKARCYRTWPQGSDPGFDSSSRGGIFLNVRSNIKWLLLMEKCRNVWNRDAWMVLDGLWQIRLWNISKSFKSIWTTALTFVQGSGPSLFGPTSSPWCLALQRRSPSTPPAPWRFCRPRPESWRQTWGDA